MKKSIGQIHSLLENEEETIVLELLDVTSPELVASYKHKVRERYDYISKHYEDSPEEIEERYYRYEERYQPRGLGSRQVWEEAGFDDFNDDY